MTNNYVKIRGAMLFFDDRNQADLTGKLMAFAEGHAAWEVALWKRPEKPGPWSRFRQVGEDNDLYMLVQLVSLDSAAAEDVVRAMRAVDGYHIHGLGLYGSMIKELRQRYYAAMEQAGIFRPRAEA